MRKVSIIILLLLATICYKVKAQKQGQALVDSLLTELQNLKEDTNKVNLLYKLSAAYYSINPDEGILYANREMELAEKLNWQKGKAWANNNLGVNYWAKSDYPKALEYYFKALKMGEEQNDKALMTRALGNIGIIYFEQSNYSKALEFDLRAVKLFEELGDKNAVARNLGNIGEVYFKQGNYLKALESYNRAISMNEELGRKSSKALNLAGIGDVYLSQLNYKKAVEYYFMALNINRQLTIKRAISECFSKLSSAYLSIVKSNDAAILKELFSENKTAALQQAQNFADSSIAISKEIGDLSSLIVDYANLSEVMEQRGDNKGALTNFRYYAIIKDSVFNLEKNKKINQAIMQYEIDKRNALAKAQQEKKDTEARRIRTIQFAASALFLIIALFLFWNNRQKQRAKIKIQKAYAELKSTQQQLIQSEKMASLGELTAGIAHEIQNPLNFVNNFSEVNKEMIAELKEEINNGNYDEVKIIADDIEANEEKINHHGKRADAIVKSMLQHSRSSSGKKEPTDINALCDEYLRLSYHGLRAKDKSFNAKFETSFDNSIKKINVVSQEIGRVILNLINNAFYAVNEKAKGNIDGYEPTVIVSTKRINDKIMISVKDNGSGIPDSIKEKIFQPFFTTKPTGQGTGLGLSLSYDIITKGHGGELKVETKEGEGSEFIIQLSV